MIAANSRYSASTVVVANNLDGIDIRAIVPGIQSSYSFNYALYQVRQFDTLADIAYSNYGDPALWYVVADANPEILLWDTIPVGILIRVPVSANGLS